jgi:adenylate kinase
VPPAVSTIRFPVIRSLEISGYALFPGISGSGIAAPFENGVSIIAGINGLGKTTVLNALLRTLIGPWDVRREDAEDVGSTRHDLIRWRTPGYFRGRVPDDAASATVSSRITFGSDAVYIVRSLADLSIEQLFHNDEQLDNDEAAYQTLVKQLSGVDSYYDFHFLVRNLVFYLEDRRPLLWSDDGQFEIVRILFIPGAEATVFSTLYDEIKTVDSRYRNLLTETNRLVKRLNDQKRAAGSLQSNLTAIAVLRDAYQGGEAALELTETELDGFIGEERALSEEIRRRQIEHEATFRQYEGLQQAYFARAFPSAGETFHYLLAHIVAGGGCFACGSDATAKGEELKRQIADGHCPICDSPPSAQEGVVVSQEVAAERVNRAARDLAAREAGLKTLGEERKRKIERIEGLLAVRREKQDELVALHQKINAIGARLPASSEVISELEVSVKINQENVSRLLKDRTEKIIRYRQMMEAASQRIMAAHVEIKRHFQNYVGHFLAETCELNFRSRKRAIGESGQSVDFPGFDVMMTSSVFPDQPQPRLTRADISESQKEFIDLAFRMALIRTAEATDGGAMLVLETPEASLDSLFIYRAGDLLRNFAEEGGVIGNVLIASSNLNDANMIPALLGIDRAPESPSSEIEARMINLLDVAAPNAAMSQQGDQYRDQYKRATTPDPKRLPNYGAA